MSKVNRKTTTTTTHKDLCFFILPGSQRRKRRPGNQGEVTGLRWGVRTVPPGLGALSMHRESFLHSHLCIQGERGMDGASIVGPPGPRGPPGRVEVLPSVSIIQVRTWLFSAFAKGKKIVHNFSVAGYTRGTWPASGTGVSPCQHAPPLCFHPGTTILSPGASRTLSAGWQHLQS